MLHLDPGSEKIGVIPMPRANAAVRQILRRPAEMWLPESGEELVTVVRTG